MGRSTPSIQVLVSGAVLLVLGAAVVLRLSPARGGADGLAPDAGSLEVQDSESAAELAPIIPGETLEEEVLIVASPEVDRVAVEVAVEPAAAPEPGESLPLQGFVLDAAGRPLAEVDLIYQRAARDEVGFERAPRAVPSRRKDTFGRPLSGTARTNAHGEFLFEGVDRGAGGVILFKPDEYIEGYVAAPVDPESDWQSLQALPTPHQDCSHTFWVTGNTVMGAVEVESVGVQHIAGSFDFPRRYPLEGQRRIEMGERATKIVQEGLSPGTWRFTFVLRHGLRQRVEIKIDEPGTAGESTILVEAWPGASATDIEFAAAADGSLPWIDSSSGLQEWLPEDRLRIGEMRYDLYFAETLRVGHGPVKAAELTIRLRSLSGMCYNDSIYLEHQGARGFAWALQIEKLLGRWRDGMTRTIHLDLARLPLEGGGSFDLRPLLEDGLLDVVLQDDTAIEALSIRIVR